MMNNYPLVTHLCIGELGISSGYGLFPVQRQAIT